LLRVVAELDTMVTFALCLRQSGHLPCPHQDQLK
jgi:hypothetical protein